MSDFVEVADRVWVARHDWFDVNVTVVAGRRGLVIVDTNASEAAARGVADAVGRLGAGPVVALINTHEHFDHTFGNAVFRDDDETLQIHAHAVAAGRTVAAGERIKRAYAADPGDPHAKEVQETRIVPADQPFAQTATVDLDDRLVELWHPGRGHTAGDLVAGVPDADVLVAGDLVEESAPPAFGADSHPMDWPGTLGTVIERLTDRTVVVPGHGAIVDRAFVVAQTADIKTVADTIRDLEGRGIPRDGALDAAAWPWDRSHLRHALVRGYDQLRLGGGLLPV